MPGNRRPAPGKYYEKVYLKSGVCVPSSEKKHKEWKQLYLKWRGKSRWELS